MKSLGHGRLHASDFHRAAYIEAHGRKGQVLRQAALDQGLRRAHHAAEGRLRFPAIFYGATNMIAMVMGYQHQIRLAKIGWFQAG